MIWLLRGGKNGDRRIGACRPSVESGRGTWSASLGRRWLERRMDGRCSAGRRGPRHATTVGRARSVGPSSLTPDRIGRPQYVRQSCLTPVRIRRDRPCQAGLPDVHGADRTRGATISEREAVPESAGDATTSPPPGFRAFPDRSSGWRGTVWSPSPAEASDRRMVSRWREVRGGGSRGGMHTRSSKMAPDPGWSGGRESSPGPYPPTRDILGRSSARP